MKLILGAVLCLSSAAGAQVVPVHPGETVTIRFDDGRPVLEGSGPAQPMTPYEMYILSRAQNQAVPPGVKQMPPSFAREGEGPPHAPHPSNDRLQITMRRVPASTPGAPDGTMLLLANGYGSALRYHAVIRSADRSAPTDVCDAVPHLLGLEYWPYVIDELDLSDLQLVNLTGAIQCS